MPVVVGLLALSPHQDVAARQAAIVFAYALLRGIGLSFSNNLMDVLGLPRIGMSRASPLLWSVTPNATRDQNCRY